MFYKFLKCTHFIESLELRWGGGISPHRRPFGGCHLRPHYFNFEDARTPGSRRQRGRHLACTAGSCIWWHEMRNIFVAEKRGKARKTQDDPLSSSGIHRHCFAWLCNMQTDFFFSLSLGLLPPLCHFPFPHFPPFKLLLLCSSLLLVCGKHNRQPAPPPGCPLAAL